MRWYHWTTIALGAWLIVSPWVLGFASINLALWNNVIAGIVFILLALWNFTSE